eukprot:5715293-Ditylum_brightwellii.AAC.1
MDDMEQYELTTVPVSPDTDKEFATLQNITTNEIIQVEMQCITMLNPKSVADITVKQIQGHIAAF